MLKQIKPVWFSYNGQAGIQTGDRKFVGIIAQDMQKIAPYMVGRFTYQDPLGNKTEYLDYDANAVTYMLINSVKEQQQMIEEKNKENRALTERVEKLEHLVASLAGKTLNRSLTAREEAGNHPSIAQNEPNGFSQSTSIKYFVPLDVKKAVIDIYTVDGVKVASHAIMERGAGELNISADRLKSGVLVYDLITDGKHAGARKMVVNK